MKEDNINKELTLADIRKEVAEHQETEQKKGERIQIIVFKLGQGEYAIPIDQIKEVVITPGIAKVPQTPSYVKGVSNIRGNVIAIMDLMEKFDLEDVRKGEKANYTLVIESDQFKIGILVREVPNTLTIYESDINNSSNIMQYSSLDDDHIRGIVNVNNRLIILVNILSMMEIKEVNELIKS